jgi:hypothetical protein
MLDESVDAGLGTTDTLIIDHNNLSSALYVYAAPSSSWSASAYDEIGLIASGSFLNFEVLEATGGSGNDYFQTYHLIPAELHGGTGVDTWVVDLSDEARQRTIDLTTSPTLSGIEVLNLTVGLGQYTVVAGDDVGESYYYGEGYYGEGDVLTINYSELTSDVTHTDAGDGAGLFSDGENTVSYSGVERISFTSGSGNDIYTTTASGAFFEYPYAFYEYVDAGAGAGASADADTLIIDHTDLTTAINLYADPSGYWSASAYDPETGYSTYSGSFLNFEAVKATGGSRNDYFHTYHMIPAELHGGAGLDTWVVDLSDEARQRTIDLTQPSLTLSGIEVLNLTVGLGQYTVVAGDNDGEVYDYDTLTINYGSLTSDVTHTDAGNGAGAFFDSTNWVDYSGIEQIIYTSGSGSDIYSSKLSGAFYEYVDAGSGAGTDTLIIDHTDLATAINVYASTGGSWSASAYDPETGFSYSSSFSNFEVLKATGGSGNDTFTISGLSAEFYGGEGVDTAVFNGTRTQFDVSFTEDVTTVTRLGTTEKVHLSEVEQLQFSDGNGTSLIVDFEDRAGYPAPGYVLTDGYMGFNWRQGASQEDPEAQYLWTIDEDYGGVPGYKAASIEPGTMVAVTPYGNSPIIITRTSGADFDFESVYLTSGFDETQSVTLTAYDDGVVIAGETLTINNDAPTVADVSWRSIDRLEISHSGSHIALDNVAFIL